VRSRRCCSNAVSWSATRRSGRGEPSSGRLWEVDKACTPTAGHSFARRVGHGVLRRSAMRRQSSERPRRDRGETLTTTTPHRVPWPTH
jgi:hypothetical protein